MKAKSRMSNEDRILTSENSLKGKTKNCPCRIDFNMAVFFPTKTIFCYYPYDLDNDFIPTEDNESMDYLNIVGQKMRCRKCCQYTWGIDDED